VSELQGLRILVVEDEFFVALLLEQELRSAGCSIVGPFADLASATKASRKEEFALALLDINLNGEMVYPLADELFGRNVPFVLLSGYGPSNLPERFRAAPSITKPYDSNLLIREIRQLAGSAV